MFRYDGPIFELISKATDLVVLGILWTIMCIPIFTIGASTTAAYYVAFSLINDKDGYVIKKFFKSFKLNFVQSTMIFLISTAAITLASINLNIINSGMLNMNAVLKIIVIVTQLFIIFEASVFAFFGYSILSKIEFTNKNLIKTAFLLGNKHILTAILNVLVIFAIYLAMATMPVVIIFAAGAYLILSANLMKRVIVKYKPDVFDKNVINDDLSFKVEIEEQNTTVEESFTEYKEEDVATDNEIEE